jgi:hypothetical protein
MDFLDDPDEMTPEARLREVAAILAAGYLRLRSGGHVLAQEPSGPAAPPDKPLDCVRRPKRPWDRRLTEREVEVAR